MKILFALIVVMCMAFTTTSEPTEYTWSKDYKVNLNDFQVDKNMPNNHLAMISTGINVNYTYQNGYTFRVFAIADRKLSKISQRVYDGYRQKEVLEHEQIHFDIAEYVSRLLNNKLKNVKDTNTAVVLYNKHIYILELMQETYDAQTDHSNDKLWETKWRNKMDSLLSLDTPSYDWKMYPY